MVFCVLTAPHPAEARAHWVHTACTMADSAHTCRPVQRGVFLAVEKLPVLCFRTFLKRVHEAQLELGGHVTQISLAVVTAAVVAIGDEAVDIDEVQSFRVLPKVVHSNLYLDQKLCLRIRWHMRFAYAGPLESLARAHAVVACRCRAWWRC